MRLVLYICVVTTWLLGGCSLNAPSPREMMPDGEPTLTAQPDIDQVRLNWSYYHNDSASVLNYRVYRKDTDSLVATLGASARSWVDPDVKNTETYEYWVSAVKQGEGALSNSVLAVPWGFSVTIDTGQTWTLSNSITVEIDVPAGTTAGITITGPDGFTLNDTMAAADSPASFDLGTSMGVFTVSALMTDERGQTSAQPYTDTILVGGLPAPPEPQ
jgi:hypothetical protein